MNSQKEGKDENNVSKKEASYPSADLVHNT